MYSQAFVAAALVAIARIATGQVIIQPTLTGALTSSIYYSCFPAPTGGAQPTLDLDVNVNVNVYVEVYVESFLNICAGGPCNQEYNITQTCTRDVPCTRPPVPPGFTVTVKDCGCAASTQVIVTEPCATASMTSGPIVTGVPGGGSGNGGSGGNGGAGGNNNSGTGSGNGGSGGAGGAGGNNSSASGSGNGGSGGAGGAGGSNNGAVGATGAAGASGTNAKSGGAAVTVAGGAAMTGSASVAGGSTAKIFTGGAAAMGVSSALMLAVAGVMFAL